MSGLWSLNLAEHLRSPSVFQGVWGVYSAIEMRGPGVMWSDGRARRLPTGRDVVGGVGVAEEELVFVHEDETKMSNQRGKRCGRAASCSAGLRANGRNEGRGIVAEMAVA